MRPDPRSELVFGFHPTSRGFGWVLFQGPCVQIDWGIVRLRRDKKRGTLQHLEALFNRYRPEIVVFETVDRRTGKRATNIGTLCRSVSALAAAFGMEAKAMGRREIAVRLGLPPTATRHEIACQVARHVETLRDRQPPEPRPWHGGSDPRWSLMSAAAAALAHYADEGEWRPTNRNEVLEL